MTRSLPALIGLSLLSAGVFAQQPLPPFKSYSSAEDYCRDKPQMPTCRDGKPINITDIEKTWGNQTPGRPLNVAPRPQTQIAPTLQGPAQMVAIQDWRFSHPSPALLMNINFASLLQSPVWGALFPALGAESMGLKAEDLVKAKAALSDIGQVLVSLAGGATPNPSVLMLVRGNLDGPLGAILRSEAGLQAKRLDEVTMLIGDPGSLQFAVLRMRNAAAKSTNPLLQTASLEAMKYDAWVGADPRLVVSMGRAFHSTNPALGMMGALRGVSMGMYLRDQIRVEGLVDAPSADAAERMRAAFQPQLRQQPGAQAWITAEGSKLRMIAIVDPGKMKEAPGMDAATARMIGTQLAPVIQYLAAMSSSSSVPSASSPASSSSGAGTPPGRIVIQGLDGGPKALTAK